MYPSLSCAAVLHLLITHLSYLLDHENRAMGLIFDSKVPTTVHDTAQNLVSLGGI